ncbi:MAG: DUF3987 domain-containing protein [Kiritimatiellae bacterium]|nr:DUF3987 domain-containing protein [Kiritimatiellia bacterium]
MTNDNKNILDFQDPGSISAEMLDVPGFINTLKEHTLAVSPRPNPPLAFAGALAMLAHLGGRSYMDEHGLRTNLYLAALAPTGMGKEEPRTTNRRLAAAAGLLDSVPDDIASGEGLEDAIEANPSLLLQTDEADALLTAMRGGDSRAAKMNAMVLRLFSEAKSVHAKRLKAGDGAAKFIPFPHLTLFATGIPKFVYAALSAKALENGLLGRCLFLETHDFCPLGEMAAQELPPDCVETAKVLAAREVAFNETGVLQPIVAVETPEAKLKLALLRTTVDETARRLFDSGLGTAAALYCRLYEKVRKLVLLYAISANPAEPQITAEAVAWASSFATHITKKMLYEVQFYAAEGKFDAIKKRFMAYLASAPDGVLSRSELLHKLHIDANMFKRVVLTLHMCDLINEEQVSRNKYIYSLKKAS